MNKIESKIKFPAGVPILLDGRPVEQITAFLFPKGGNEDPQKLQANAGKSFQGSIVLGMGFTFDDTDKKDIASPIAEMNHLIGKDPRNAERIFPFIGYDEVTNSPTHSHHRYVINFGEMSEEKARRWPDLMAIIEKKVKEKRLKDKRETYRRYWWQFCEKRVGLYKAISQCDRVLVTTAQASSYLSLIFYRPDVVFANSLNIFPLERDADFAVLQSRVHEVFARFFSSSVKDDLRYNPSDCFETFPFPEGTLTPSPSPRAGEGDKIKEGLGEGDKIKEGLGEGDKSQSTTLTPPSPRVGEGGRGGEGLEAIGKTYYEYRAALMVRNNQGLTDTYNRFHDPHEDDPEILKLRELHDQMDRAVLDAYGWPDILGSEPSRTPCGFTLDYLDEDPETLPPEAKERVESGNLFFDTAAEAAAFDVLVRGNRAKRGKLPWRYKWPEAIHDEVLARLLALNQTRYEAEIRLGLHSKTNPAPKAPTEPKIHRPPLPGF